VNNLIVSVNGQAMLFLFTVEAGIAIGIFYDLFRITRKIFHHPNWMIHIEDLLYWIFIALFMFFLLFSKNYGEIRGFALLGALIGNVLYFLTLSPYFMRISTWMINWIKKIIRFLIKILLVPVRFIKRIFSYPYRFAVKYVTKLKKYTAKKGRKCIKQLYIIIKKI
jgi:spore cortex biosynthesis protein YabQ